MLGWECYQTHHARLGMPVLYWSRAYYEGIFLFYLNTNKEIERKNTQVVFVSREPQQKMREIRAYERSGRI